LTLVDFIKANEIRKADTFQHFGLLACFFVLMSSIGLLAMSLPSDAFSWQQSCTQYLLLRVPWQVLLYRGNDEDQEGPCWPCA
jgi:hypothetical protein